MISGDAKARLVAPHFSRARAFFYASAASHQQRARTHFSRARAFFYGVQKLGSMAPFGTRLNQSI
jgi:hypothetical protein